MAPTSSGPSPLSFLGARAGAIFMPIHDDTREIIKRYGATFERWTRPNDYRNIPLGNYTPAGVYARCRDMGVTIVRNGDELELHGSVEAVEAVKMWYGVTRHKDGLLVYLAPAPWDLGLDAESFDPAALEQLPRRQISEEEAEFREIAGTMEDNGATKQEAEIYARKVSRFHAKQRAIQEEQAKGFDQSNPAPDR